MRVLCDGTNVTVKEATTEAGLDEADDCYTSSNFSMDGGFIGFAGPNYIYIDDLTVEYWDGDYHTAVVEDFEVDAADAEDEPTYDAAGNLTYDGLYGYTYDAWNRLVKVKHAYPGDRDGTSTAAEMKYDGLGRRIVKIVGDDCDTSHEMGDWEATYHYYYSGHSLIETRDGSDAAIKQHVWGTRYIDELLQIGINSNPTSDNTCTDSMYWVAHDANYNVIGLFGWDDGITGVHFDERYEYTPYGQRTVYTSSGSSDALVSAPLIESQRACNDRPYGLCPFGHQGLLFDKEFNLYYNRARMLHPTLMRFLQRDPLGYEDGMSLYEYLPSGPRAFLDPYGLVRSHPSPEQFTGTRS